MLVDKTQAGDVELVMQAQNGNLQAYSELVNKYQLAVYGIVSRMIDRPEDVDDVVQDVFVLAYRSIDKFRGDSEFSTWVYRIAVNTTIKCLKKMKYRQTVSIDDPEVGVLDTLTSDDTPLPAEAAEICERRREVRKAVDKLPEKHRVVVVLRYFEDYSCEDIAKILDCSVGTVWSRLHYACRKLQGQLDWLETA